MVATALGKAAALSAGKRGVSKMAGDALFDFLKI